MGKRVGEARVPGIGSVALELVDEGDRGRLLEFFRSLSLETIWNRFLEVVRDFEGIVSRVLDRESTPVAVSAVVEGSIAGLAEVYGSPKGRTGEAAIITAEAYRGKGLGTALLYTLLVLARAKGFEILEGFVHRSNTPALRLARSFGAAILEYEPPILLARFNVEHSILVAREKLSRKNLKISIIVPHPLHS
ncbi:MAG: GNAT family N-acetyltransferase [Thermoproteota archaeon]